MGGKRILSDAQIDEMCALREKGWGTRRIAEHFTNAGTPISEGSVSWQCLVNGADAPPRLRGKSAQASAPYRRNGHLVRPYSADDDALLRILDMQGCPVAVIARRLARKPNSIRGRLATLARQDARAEEAGYA
ncbi:MAG: hypothetical protein JKX86_07115 [Verrucomicrobiales bacterium]|nr:hypothetical protein [Verrucomicrobiales bacterium]